MVQQPPEGGFEDSAVRLLRHLEWQNGFSIVFLFVDDGQAERLRLWLNQRLDFAGRPIHRVIPVEFPGEPGVLVERLLTLPHSLPRCASLDRSLPAFFRRGMERCPPGFSRAPQ